MKKAAAIFLLMIYLFDVGAYLVMHQYMVYRSDHFFEEQIEKNFYNKNDLVEVAIPVSMPGIHDWAGYERISGQIRFKDNAYNYVQMKITSHMLYLKCVPDYKTTRLNDNNVIDAGPIKDVPVPKKEHVPYTGALFMNGFGFTFQDIILKSPVIRLTQYTTPYLQLLIDRHIDIPKQPPKQAC